VRCHGVVQLAHVLQLHDRIQHLRKPGPGAVLDASLSAIGVTLQSTLMSNNIHGAAENDLLTVHRIAGDTTPLALVPHYCCSAFASVREKT
jgi:hypothetical protein